MKNEKPIRVPAEIQKRGMYKSWQCICGHDCATYKGQAKCYECNRKWRFKVKAEAIEVKK